MKKIRNPIRNRMIAGLLAVVMAFMLMPMTALTSKVEAAEPDLIIRTYEELIAFADAVNGGETFEGKTIRLDVNVELGGEKNPWTPIGTSTNPFKGTFDGGYHVISGLYINTTNQYAGLFGYVGTGTVENLTVRGTITGTGTAAGIVGYLKAGIVKNCGNETDVTGGSGVGGVVGALNGACTIERCFNKGTVVGITGYIGGVVGQSANGCTVTDCRNSGSVTGPATVGGCVGGHKAYKLAISNCYNAGTVVDSTGKNNYIGAVVGASKGTNTNCYYIAGTGTDTKAGITEVGAGELTATMLGDAFDNGTDSPVLTWESKISTATPVRRLFEEKTELSATLSAYIKAAVNSKKKNAGVSGTLLGNPDYLKGASSTDTDWMALAMGRFGYYDVDGTYRYLIDDGEGYALYLAAMKDYMESTYAENNGVLHSAKATEWHRAVVAIAALGGDPSDFGSYDSKPIDLIADGSYNCVLKKGPGTQGINGWIWGLISMDTLDHAVPSDAKYPRETFITEVLKMQLTDGVNGNEYGGWVLGGYGTKSDVDITAMAIQSLAPYYNDDTVYTYKNENSGETVSKTVHQCVDEALERLGSMFSDDAGFSSWGTNNVESISQVLVALCSIGIDPAKDARFITSDGKTLLDGILNFRLSDGGFCHVKGGGFNSMATDQAAYALVSYWRLENGMRALYDMRENPSETEQQAVDAAVSAIDGLPDPSDASFKASLKSALTVFEEVPEKERRYVGNYAYLASAIALVGGREKLDADESYAVSIRVSTAPDKVKYYENETFDPTGMVIFAVYSDGTEKQVTDYRFSPAGELVLGTDTVLITYGILQTAVSITVREKMPWDGEGTSDDPYLIRTADDLMDLYSYVAVKKMPTADVHFRMTQDINMKNIADWRGIADGSSYLNAGFCGHFDGAGYSIWNLNAKTYHVAGLFGKLGDGALIENLTIASGCIKGENYDLFSCGGIAGEIEEDADVTIKNCHNYAAISGTWGVGGIVGKVSKGSHLTVENCSNHGAISASYTGGGMIGQVGENRWKENGATATVFNSYNTGTIGGKGAWGNGGIIGCIRLGGSGNTSGMRSAGTITQIENCYNTGAVSGSVTGGIFGSVAESGVKLENVYYLDTSCDKVNGVFTDDGKDAEGDVDGTATAMNESSMKQKSFVTMLGSAFASDVDNINDGYPGLSGQKAVGEEAPVRAGLEIATAEGLVDFANRVNAGENFKGKTVMLTAHIDLGKVLSWTPAGLTSALQFEGTFDGQGYVIDNLTSPLGGLFKYVGTSAVIRNVGVASGEIGSEETYTSFLGGIAGWSNGADFINCWNGADIYASGYSAGIVGTIRDGGESVISGCYNVGNIYGKGTALGGIVGHLDTSRTGTSVHVTVTDCYNTGEIQGNYYIGGIVGQAQDGHHIKNCYNAGTVTAQTENNAGGIAGSVTSDNTIGNCYYCSELNAAGIVGGTDTTIGKTAAEMKDDAFLKLLGKAFQQDRYSFVNNGYPLLSWQKTEEADEKDAEKEKVDAVINLVKSIGEVTKDSKGAIDAARAAYNALSEELKSLVKNYSDLVNAEGTYAALLEAEKKPSDHGTETSEKENSEKENSETENSESENPEAENPGTAPGTGDSTYFVSYVILLYVTVMILGFMGVAVFAKKEFSTDGRTKRE